MDTDLDTLATALYVTCDDLLDIRPEHAPYRPVSGFEPAITDAELITLAVMSALLGYTSERRWLRYAHQNLRAMFPALPGQSGYNKRLRKLAHTIAWLISVLGADTSVGDDDLWVVDSTPVECARSTETVKRSDLAGWAQYGYCASHSRYFWGLRLHLLCTVHGLPLGWALTGAKADERDVLIEILTTTPTLGRTPGHRRRSSATRTITAAPSRPPWPTRASPCSDQPARARHHPPVTDSSNPYGRSSNRSTTPSKANSTSNTTTAAPSPESAPASDNASWP